MTFHGTPSIAIIELPSYDIISFLFQTSDSQGWIAWPGSLSQIGPVPDGRVGTQGQPLPMLDLADGMDVNQKNGFVDYLTLHNAVEAHESLGDEPGDVWGVSSGVGEPVRGQEQIVLRKKYHMMVEKRSEPLICSM